MSEFPWSELGIAQTRDQARIRKAYSARLKELDLDRQIVEYTNLREARALALYLAQQEDEDQDDLGVGLLDEEAEPSGPARSEAYDPQDAAPYQEADNGLDPAVNAAWNTLHGLVFPDGKQEDDGFSSDDFASAELALETLLDHAANGEIGLANSIDFNLAELMAQGWPRTAPLVERCNAEFHWLGEAGQLIERPALQFLNARIAGMRFHEEVLQPDHPLHKAWQDLEGDSTPIWIKRWSVGRDKITELLTIIRGYHPELEYLLSGERIQKWEDSGGSIIATMIWWGVGIYGGLVVLGFLAGVLGLTEPTPDADPMDSPVAQELVDAAAAEAFGTGWTNERILQLDAPFAERFRNAALRGAVTNQGFNRDDGIAAAQDFVRSQMLAARESAEFDDLLQIQQVHLALLQAARADDPRSCKAMLNWVDFTPENEAEVLSASQLALGRQVAVGLLEKGLLLEEPVVGTRTTPIPGWVVEGVMGRTGLSETAVNDAFSGDADPNRCNVMIGLVETIASAPGRVEPALLRLP